MAAKEQKVISRTVTRTGLAEVFGVAMPTIDSWVRAGCPFVQKGGRGVEWQFDTAAVARWREQKAVADATGDTIVEEAELKRRKLQAETTKAELELAKARGEVAPIREFERTMAAMMAAIRQNMRNVVPRAELQLLGETDSAAFKKKLLAEIDLALTQSANAEPDIEDDEEADGE